MPLIASINGETRRIYLDPLHAVGGVLTFHPTVDLYPAYRALRRTNEAVRPFDPLMAASGNQNKNAEGTRKTPRFTRLLQGAKVVIPAGIGQVVVSGELLTDDGTSPFDVSLVTGPCIIDYAPAEAEVIEVTVGGNDYSLEQIASAVAPAVWAHSSGVAITDRVTVAATILRNKTVTDPATGIMTVFADDGTTPLLTATLYENAAGTQAYRGQGSERRERLA